ncbi:hypothetical protein CL614_06150 [archaeon]|nr:hypothetical protein [archaeon]|tara:strand:- start:3174 stop:3794 length:621 start_codon:yes stop_codon:yes gene_type:complete
MKFIALILAAAIVVIFLLQMTISGFTEFMLLIPASFSGYEIITHMFIHADYTHLFYNLFALALFGTILNNVIGDKRFVILFVIAGLIAGVSAFIFYADSSVLGASGAIMGIMGTLGVLRPKMTVWVIGAPMPMIAAVAVYAFIDLAGLIGGSQGIANGAHLFGLIAGIVYGFFLRSKHKLQESKKTKYTVVHIGDKEMHSWEDKWF